MADHGLRSAHLFDGQGGARPLDWQALQSWKPQDGFLWGHFDGASAEAQSWLVEEHGLGAVVVEGLFAMDTRPRLDVVSGGALLILRALNVNPDADPEDMVSLRLWVDKDRAVSVRIRQVRAAVQVRDALHNGDGPDNAGQFIVRIAKCVTDNVTPELVSLDDDIAEIESAIEDGVLQPDTFARMADYRRRILRLRRCIAPQAEVIAMLAETDLRWLSADDKARLRGIHDRVVRQVETLDLAREHVVAASEALTSRQAAILTRNTYVIAVIGAILLPLNFVAGMLGMNVGGIPLAKNDAGFWIMAGGFASFALVGWLLLRRRKWM